MATTATKIGRVSINPQGEYSSGTQYQRLDVVTYQGSGYICIQDCQNKPVTNTAYWYLLASKGDTYEVTEEDLQRIALQIEEDASSLFNQLVAQKTSEFNTNATQKTNDFNSNATSKTSDFNSNATSKTSDFNTNATAKTTGFNQNATEKTTGFDANYNDKVGLFNGNATTKTTDFNTNATEKTSAFDEHVDEQTEDFDEHVESYSHRLDLLESNFDEKNPTPSDNITVTDAINAFMKKYTLNGKTIQATTSIAGGDEYDSPSPAHPQPINNVDENFKINIGNKNLYNSSSSYNVNASVQGSTFPATVGDSRYTYFVNVKGSTTYTISAKTAGDRLGVFELFNSVNPDNYTTNNKLSFDNIVRAYNADAVREYTFTTSPQTKMIAIYYSYQTLPVDFMIEESSTATTYVQYKGKQVTFPLSTGQKMYKGDYLADDGIHHTRKQFTLDGTQTITRVPASTAPLGYYFRYDISQLAKYKTGDSLDVVRATRFKAVANSLPLYVVGTVSIGVSRDAISFVLPVDVTTQEQAQQWFSTNNTIFEYELEKEEIEPYTEAQQTAWNELQKLETYKNTTHVYTSSDDLSPDSDFVYLVNPLASIEARLDLLEE